jgi:hypothetical protein
VRLKPPQMEASVTDASRSRGAHYLIRKVSGQADVLGRGGVIESIGGADVIEGRCRCGIFPSPAPDMRY